MADHLNTSQRSLQTSKTRSTTSLMTRKRAGPKAHVVHSGRMRNSSSRNLSKLGSTASLSTQDSGETVGASTNSSATLTSSSARVAASSNSQISEERQQHGEHPRKVILSVGGDDDDDDEDDTEEEETYQKNDTYADSSRAPPQALSPPPLRNGQQVASPVNKIVPTRPTPRPNEGLTTTQHLVSDDDDDDSEEEEERQEAAVLPTRPDFQGNLSAHSTAKSGTQDNQHLKQPGVDTSTENGKPPFSTTSQSESLHKPTSSATFMPSLVLADNPAPPQVSNETVLALVGSGSSIAESLAADHSIKHKQKTPSQDSLRGRIQSSAFNSQTPNTPVRHTYSNSHYGTPLTTTLASTISKPGLLPAGQSLTTANNITSHFLDGESGGESSGASWNNDGSNREQQHNSSPMSGSVSQKPTSGLQTSFSSSDLSVINGMKSLAISSNTSESRTQQKLWRMRENALAESSSPNQNQFDRVTLERRREEERMTRELANVRRYVSPLYDSVRRVRMRRGEDVPPAWMTIANQQNIKAAAAAKAISSLDSNGYRGLDSRKNPRKYQSLQPSPATNRPSHLRTTSVDADTFRSRLGHTSQANGNGKIYHTLADQRTPKKKSSTASINELSQSLPKHSLVMSATTLADLLGESTFNSPAGSTPGSVGSVKVSHLERDDENSSVKTPQTSSTVNGYAGANEYPQLKKTVSTSAFSGGFRPTTSEGIQKVSAATWTSKDREVPQLIGTIVRNTAILQALLKRLWTQPFYDPVDGNNRESNAPVGANGKNSLLSPQSQGQQQNQISPSILAQAQQAQHKMMIAQAQQAAAAKAAQSQKQHQGTQTQQQQQQLQMQREIQQQQDAVAQAQARRAQHYQLQQQQIQQAQQLQQQQRQQLPLQQQYQQQLQREEPFQSAQQTFQQPESRIQPSQQRQSDNSDQQLKAAQLQQQQYQQQQLLQAQAQAQDHNALQQQERMRPPQPGATIQLNKPL